MVGKHVTSPPPLEAEALLRHMGWMRRLALRILRDESLAEDAVHEAYLVALQAPPADPIPLSGWLHTVVRRIAHHKLYGTQNRREISASSSSQPAVALETASPLEQAEAHKLVMDALLSLEEPYRTTLTLRFIRDMSCAEIAQETGISESGVRNRIQRGLAKLKERFRKRYGEAWGGPLFAILGFRLPPVGPPPAIPAPIPSPPPAIPALGLPTPLLALGALALTGAGILLLSRPTPVDAASSASLQAPLRAPSSSSQQAPHAAPLGALPAPAEDIAAPGSPAIPLPVLHRIRALLPDGRMLFPALGLPPSVGGLTVVATSGLPGRSLSAGDRLPLEDASPFSLGGFGEYHPLSLFSPAQDRVPGLIGELRVQHAPPYQVALLLGSRVLATRRVTAPEKELRFVVPLENALEALGGIRFRLLDGDGRPLRSPHLELDGRRIGTGTDQGFDPIDGNWNIAGLPSGILHLLAEAPGTEVRVWRIALGPGETHDLGALRLLPARPLSGFVLDATAHRPVANAEVSLLDLDRVLAEPSGLQQEARVLSARDGRFTFPKAGPRRYLLMATAPGRMALPEVVDARPEIPSVPELLLRKCYSLTLRERGEPSPRSRLVRILDPRGLPLWAARIHPGESRRAELPLGTYSIQVEGSSGTLTLRVQARENSLTLP